MKHILANISENTYFESPEVTVITHILTSEVPKELMSGLDDITYTNLLMKYGEKPTPTTDLFKFLESSHLDNLKNNKNHMLFFDCTFEGYSLQDKLIAQSLEYSCIMHGVNPKKIFLFTGNLKEISYEIGINIVPAFLLHLSFAQHDISIRSMSESVELTKQLYKKFALSLSRRCRNHRVWAHFMLYKSGLVDDCIVSQNKIEDSFYLDQNVLRKIGLSDADFIEFSEQLPMIADEDNFHINSPFAPISNLHASTAFSIVNETLVDNYNNTSLFFSEKILKPMLNYQPMIIYGQQGINRKLSMLGVKTYESYFNLDFDDEPDDHIRYKKLLSSVSDTMNYLKSLTRNQQIAWRYKEVELLEYNHRAVFDLPCLYSQLTHFFDLIRGVIK